MPVGRVVVVCRSPVRVRLGDEGSADDPGPLPPLPLWLGEGPSGCVGLLRPWSYRFAGCGTGLRLSSTHGGARVESRGRGKSGWGAWGGRRRGARGWRDSHPIGRAAWLGWPGLATQDWVDYLVISSDSEEHWAQCNRTPRRIRTLRGEERGLLRPGGVLG